MSARLGISDQFAVNKYGPYEGNVTEMATAGIGIVNDEDVSVVYVVPELLDYGLRLEVECPSLRGEVEGALGDSVAFTVAKRRRNVAVIENKGMASVKNMLGHLVHDRRER